MQRSLFCSVLALSLLLGCDKKTDDKKADDKKADDKKADDKKADEAPPPEPAKPEAKHFDVSQDKSGVLARSAAVLETAEGIDNEALAEISHHAEKLPTDDVVCKHIASIQGEGFDVPACIDEAERHVVNLGPEVYALAVACLMDAKTSAEVEVCIEAEKEAEILLHEKAHGDGLSQETCDQLFQHFEKLAMDDAGDAVEIVKEILEETKVEILAACVDQGKQAEVDCAMKATALAELKDCASALL